MVKRIVFLVMLSLICFSLSGQVKELKSTRTNQKISIDGKLDEIIWKSVPVATEFIQQEPNPGVASKQKSEVRVVYNDIAVYIGATLYDTRMDSVFKTLTPRDNIDNVDWFGVSLDTYNSGLNGVGFVVTASGVQQDVLFADDDDDVNWDAVWRSAISHDEAAWHVEMEIPFSALRFPSDSVQDWNVNFIRSIRRYREASTWNPIDPNVNGILNQSGLLKGMADIKSPIRLSLVPFVLGGVSINDGDATFDESIGADIKYGINDAFTLDMTLIPDFSQALSDDQVLNLGPFEQFFEERRPFFTEGIELFNKAGIFYSRRVGATQVNEESEEGYSYDYPDEAKLINATKISGRTNKGTGIGVFNAFERGQSASRTDIFTGEEEEIDGLPFVNYNAIVFDQNLKNNSSVTFTNTNVIRAKSDNRNANVAALQTSLRDKKQKYILSAQANLSEQWENGDKTVGYAYNFEIAEVADNWRYGYWHNLESPDYDPNDLGFLFNPNENSHSVWLEYNQYEPVGKWNKMEFRTNVYYSRLVDPNTFSDFAINFNSFFFTRKFLAYGLSMRLEPIETFDFFEARTADLSRPYNYPTNFLINPFISTNYAKKFALDVWTTYRRFSRDNRYRISFGIEPRWTINDKAFLLWKTFYHFTNQDEGFAFASDADREVMGLADDAIVFGRRDINRIESTLTFRYTFSPNLTTDLRIRNSWNEVNYTNFAELGQDGKLINQNYVNNDSDRNVDFFNVDFNLQWRFAPGSDLIFNIKQQNSIFGDDVSRGFWRTFGDALSDDVNQVVSLRVQYYLDYFTTARGLKRKRIES